MLTRRVIPCLDVRDGRVVKGVRFAGLRDVGDPVELAVHHAAGGADELSFLDVTASLRGQSPLLDLVERVGRVLSIPFTVGGGVRTVDDAIRLLTAGADKVALGTAAVEHPALLDALAARFGSQCVVLSVDTRRVGDRWLVCTRSATDTRERDCLDWVHEGVARGAGEILLNVIDTDGVRDGYQIDLTAAVAAAVPVPVIASGGAGSAQHVLDVFLQTEASAALAATIFHDGIETPASVKNLLRQHGIEVRS